MDEADRIVACVVASAAMDDRVVDPEIYPMLRKIATGEISADDAIDSLIERLDNKP